MAVVLPALAVLALVAVVAIAATGSTPGGSSSSRPPPESLLDALFTLALIGVVAGAILLVYGLMQRKDIKRELASGRHRRMSLLGWIAFTFVFMLFAYWRLGLWHPRPQQGQTEGIVKGTPPPPSGVENPDVRTYEAELSWIAIALVLGLVVAAAVAYVIAERRARGRERAQEDLVEDVVVVLDETLVDLRAESDPRRAVIAAYARLEHVLATHGLPRRRSETEEEYLARMLRRLEVTDGPAQRLTVLFERARFSHHDVDAAMKEEAIGAFEVIRDELRAEGDPRAVLAAGRTEATA